MIKNTELSEVRVLCESVENVISRSEFITRDDVEIIRVSLTRALARINAVERMVVGVPVPRSGD